MMHGFDWVIVAGFLVALALSAWSMRRHANSVSGFLSANRLAGRYLLSIDGINTGAISMVALWELVYNAGYAAQWWGGMSAPIGSPRSARIVGAMSSRLAPWMS